MTIPSAHCKAVAKHSLSVFGGDLKIQAYYDSSKSISVDLLTTVDTLHLGVKSIGTIGLSETPLFTDEGEEFATRVELCAGALSEELFWENAVASVAFDIKKRQRYVMPGDVIVGVFNEYLKNPKMPHIYLTIPFMWNGACFPELKFASLKVNWLQCIAIHEEERVFIEKFGGDAFDDLLSDQEINTLDRNRLPVDLSSFS
ncbi:suppressor of fused domain protein [Pseudomonas sp. PSKL.D1]|uniref:suppressor of fused domain protein n=1 Tax=Pseudomonas sp. PSKL.D1 TaxID=3029060 RepID=UPI0023812488|nr:suppressor of fused domain protein [Pseudomonas sp. PSKL.D1]WDY56480.1 suppressor of fused domain protein [Pseudomonas sp. PSKL.D1]